MPGRTAFFGLQEAGKPKAGETLVVSGAAGAVGSIVVQIGKVLGCRVIGIAGSQAKRDWLTSLGADATINYKEHPDVKSMNAALSTAAPNGIDIYFDNVGGHITDAVLELINLRARVIICGQISQYNTGLDEPELGPRFLHRLIYTRATIQGILARDFTDRMPEMLEAMQKWIADGKVTYKETVVDGFENIPSALNSLFHGANTGKLVVKIAE
jgi:NADPH-dependent curcumin reductase CurA